jgi:hypothetical protein
MNCIRLSNDSNFFDFENSLTTNNSYNDIFPSSKNFFQRIMHNMDNKSIVTLTCNSRIENPIMKKDIFLNIDRLNDIGNLSYNWDGYDAKPFNFELINKCKKIVRILSYQPDIYPTGRQSIQFQYELSNKSYLEFEIFNNKTLCLWVPKRNYINAKEIEIVVSEEEHIKEMVDSFYENNGSLG